MVSAAQLLSLMAKKTMNHHTTNMPGLKSLVTQEDLFQGLSVQYASTRKRNPIFLLLFLMKILLHHGILLHNAP